MKASELKSLVDRMVGESIRRQLPEIMNEVLVRTIAGSGILTESRKQVLAPVPKRDLPKKRSLQGLLDESIGADPYGAGEMWDEPEPPRQQLGHSLTRRIKDLPPELQALAADSAESILEEGRNPGRGPDLMQAQSAGMDFSRMRQTIAVVDKGKASNVDTDRQKFEELRLARKREQLEVKP